MAGHKIIIAIDGYSSCGKSTLAKELAKKLKYGYIDSGAMYRAITLYFLRNNINFTEPSAVIDAISNINITFSHNDATNSSDIFMNDENVSFYIRDMIVSEKVSEVAALKEVRAFAVALQKRLGRKKGIVMDGRDIGTTVFPDAELKIFMTADPEIRVMRRFKELYEKNQQITIDEVSKNLELRDYLDSTREESPLRKAKDAIVVDNSNLTRSEQLEKVYDLVMDVIQEKIGSSK
jgi:CMP/dCMP kinase